VPEFPIVSRTATSDDQWQREVEKQLLESFDRQTGPLARFVVLQSDAYSDLLIVCDHLVADGMSTAWILRDLCNQLATPRIHPPAVAIPPCMSTMVPVQVKRNLAVRLAIRVLPVVFRVIHFGKQGYRLVFGDRAKPSPRPDSWEAARAKIISGLPAKALAWSLTESQTFQLRARCRAEGTTVHAALCVAFQQALEDVCELPRRRFRTVQSAVNIRARLSPPIHDECGMYAALVKTRVNCRGERAFWKTARRFRRQLNRATSPEALFAGVILLDELTHGGEPAGLRQFVNWVQHEKVSYDISISNLGQLSIPEQYGRFHIETVHGPWVLGPHQTPLIGVVTLGGRMTFSLTLQPDPDGTDRSAAIRTAAMHRLTVAMGGGTADGAATS
jgi:hypothetical protein